jgi:hypothetical protein
VTVVVRRGARFQKTPSPWTGRCLRRLAYRPRMYGSLAESACLRAANAAGAKLFRTMRRGLGKSSATWRIG